MKLKLRFKAKNSDTIYVTYNTDTPEKEKIHWGRYAKMLEEDDNLEFMEVIIK